jgi:two-component system, NarL family, sensor histidine kinase DegS
MIKPAASEPSEPPEATDRPAPSSVPELAERMSEEAVRLGIELGEVELLITQARTEAARHEARRVTASEKMAAIVQAAASSGGPPPDTSELNAQLVLLTKRAALMESQVDVLEGKQRALARFRDGLMAYAEMLSSLRETTSFPAAAVGKDKTGAAAKAADPIGSLPPAVSRLLLAAQEDMRREIARAMHDGPAQSLTNIVLQAQIVEHLVANDPTKASGEARQLVAMVQQTLDATKSFIFDVRPMVLDDLGLVPTLRRAARDRGRRAGISVEFESMGQDERLPMDLESGLFRILDEALAAYLGARADRISLKLDWSDRVEARMSASRATAKSSGEPVPDAAPSADLPPALAAMMEERRADARDRAVSAQRDAIVSLPASTWREIQGRAATLGLNVELSADGSELRLLMDLPQSTAQPA